MRITFPKLVAVAVAILVLVVGYFILNSGKERHPPLETEAVPAAPATADTAPAEKESVPDTDQYPDEIPAMAPAPDPDPVPQEPDTTLITPPGELAGSDTTVKAVLQELSPQLSAWLIPDEQVRKWVLTVDLIADGKLPKRYRPLDYPMAKFAVEKQDSTTVATDANYERLVPLLTAITAIDTARLADYYHAWKPLLQKAYQEQGKPGTFEERLLTAFSQILAVTPLQDKEALIRPTVLYHYSNEELEKASDVEKLGWRMGEDNLITLQDFVRELREQIQPR